VVRAPTGESTPAGRSSTSGPLENRCDQEGTPVPICTHTDHVKITQLPASVDGCADCLAEGTLWLHLRICLECGHVGCCDDSPMKHATAHAKATEHPIIRSLEPGEDWCWCFVDEVGMLIPDVHGFTRIPPSPLLG
jgi:uncharacterized UBP type Zn finger protein